MQITLIADGHTDKGGAPLIMHNERLADPLDPFAQWIAERSRKRGKTLADHEAMGYGEFGGGLYTNPPLTVEDYMQPNGQKYDVCLPSWNVLRCLQDGAKRHKRGPDVLRGVYPIDPNTPPLDYDGPTQPHELWKAGTFALRKTVGVQRSRTVRTRPIFTDWRFELDVEVDMTVFDVHTLRMVWHDSGIYCGIGDMRPVYGRFDGTIRDAS